METTLQRRKAGRPTGSGSGPARPLTADEIERLTAATSLRDRALVWLCLGGGLRVGEACSLLIGHCASDGSILIERSRAKSKKSRRVYLSGQALIHFQNWLATRPNAEPSQPVFPSRKGQGCMTACWASRLVDGLMGAAGVFGASSHSLRRSHANGLRRQGTDIMVISHQLGHASIEVTGRYLQLSPAEHKEQVERLKLTA